MFIGLAPFSQLFAQDHRYSEYQSEPTCGGGPPLPQKDQFKLGEVTGTTYIAHYRRDGDVKEMTFSIKTPGAFQGNDFPSDICGSKIVLSMDGGPDIRGVMEYIPSDPHAEHRPWAYAIKLEGKPMREMRFAGSYFSSIYGVVEVVGVDGSFEWVFFTGAAARRWE